MGRTSHSRFSCTTIRRRATGDAGFRTRDSGFGLRGSRHRRRFRLQAEGGSVRRGIRDCGIRGSRHGRSFRLQAEVECAGQVSRRGDSPSGDARRRCRGSRQGRSFRLQAEGGSVRRGIRDWGFGVSRHGRSFRLQAEATEALSGATSPSTRSRREPCLRRRSSRCRRRGRWTDCSGRVLPARSARYRRSW